MTSYLWTDAAEAGVYQSSRTAVKLLPALCLLDRAPLLPMQLDPTTQEQKWVHYQEAGKTFLGQVLCLVWCLLDLQVALPV